MGYESEEEMGSIEFEEVEGFRFLYKDNLIPIRYPTTTAALVVPMNTVTVLAFLLFIQNQQNFFKRWVLFPVRSYPVDYIKPFTLMEKEVEADNLPKYNPGWEQKMKFHKADLNELQNIWTDDSREHGFKGFQTIDDQFTVFESFCEKGSCKT
jgi:hypothetical protein